MHFNRCSLLPAEALSCHTRPRRAVVHLRAHTIFLRPQSTVPATIPHPPTSSTTSSTFLCAAFANPRTCHSSPEMPRRRGSAWLTLPPLPARSPCSKCRASSNRMVLITSGVVLKSAHPPAASGPQGAVQSVGPAGLVIDCDWPEPPPPLAAEEDAAAAAASHRSKSIFDAWTLNYGSPSRRFRPVVHAANAEYHPTAWP